jgi:hypothetical protein
LTICTGWLFGVSPASYLQDYRADEIKYLTASGKTADEIKEFVPPTSEERRESTRQNKNDLEQLKLDVTMLKQQVQTLTSRLEERDEHRGKDHKHSEEQEGQPLEKIRFQEEEDKEIGATKKRTLKTDDAKPKEPPMDLSQLGEVPEGDLLSGG